MQKKSNNKKTHEQTSLYKYKFVFMYIVSKKFWKPSEKTIRKKIVCQNDLKKKKLLIFITANIHFIDQKSL